MKDSFFYRNSYKVRSDIAIFFKRYRITIILLTCVFIFGFITGVFVASNYSSSLEIESIPDKNFIDFLCGEKSSFSLFFSYMILFGIAMFLIVYCNANRLCALVNYIYIFIRGYILGFTTFAIISLFSLAGILNLILFIPFWLILNFLLILISSICVAKNRVIKKFGKCCYVNNNPKSFLILLIILFIAILFLFCMCLPIIKITIIVN